MSPVEVRPFRRSDRDQLTQLVNAHAAAVVPGMSASVSAVLSALERQPGEFIEDPWVSERATLVAAQQGRIAAAAHLLRYFPDERAGTATRDVGEICWLLFWPEAPAANPCWQASAGSSTTPGSRAPTPAAWTTRVTARSFPRPDSGNSPVPGEDGTGRHKKARLANSLAWLIDPPMSRPRRT
jgi:hypothetical protein